MKIELTKFDLAYYATLYVGMIGFIVYEVTR